MANQKQVEILKQGVEVWNKWRVGNSNVTIDLSGVDLTSINLRYANLIGANFREANLQGTDLSGARLNEAVFVGANLWRAILYIASLNKANLKGANLSTAYLIEADLIEADLSGTDLRGANLSRANLPLTNFMHSKLGVTILSNNDFASSLGLETIRHDSPSTIGTDTLRKSKGKIPIEFLRGCGLSDWEIESVKLYRPDLSNDEFIDIQNRVFDLRQGQAVQISPLFISYSHADGPFVDKLEKLLNEKGIRFWRDIHDATAGRLETQIDRAIRQNPTVLLVLSENSIKSDWVQHEVHTARELEKEMEGDVLCPVALDDSWQHSPWPQRLMEQVLEYNILDCSCWQDDHEFRRVFTRLVDGLNLYYKKV